MDYFYFGDEKIYLEEIASNDSATLYRYDSIGYIVGASKEEIHQEFPDYQYDPMDCIQYDYLIVKDGVPILHDPADGSI